MKIVKAVPPNYFDICKVFNIFGKNRIVFTYGDTIYAPNKGGAISDNVKVHEKTHQKQQGDDPKGWWDRYLVDTQFRLDQELEAYRKQYRFFISKNHNINDQFRFLDIIAGDLSGEMYGNIISFEEARELLKR